MSSNQFERAHFCEKSWHSHASTIRGNLQALASYLVHVGWYMRENITLYCPIHDL
jgi:hypothetical protein